MVSAGKGRDQTKTLSTHARHPGRIESPLVAERLHYQGHPGSHEILTLPRDRHFTEEWEGTQTPVLPHPGRSPGFIPLEAQSPQLQKQLMRPTSRVLGNGKGFTPTLPTPSHSRNADRNKPGLPTSLPPSPSDSLNVSLPSPHRPGPSHKS